MGRTFYLNLCHLVGLETRRLGVQSNQALKIEMLICCILWLFGQAIGNCFGRKAVKDASFSLFPFPYQKVGVSYRKVF